MPTPHMNLFSGCNDEIQHLLTMRADVCHYCAILDMYAPCIVSYQAWNNDANMSRHCGAADLKVSTKMFCPSVMKHFWSWFS
jgi:hypothetical protein